MNITISTSQLKVFPASKTNNSKQNKTFAELLLLAITARQKGIKVIQ